ncbi:MAG: hypothetical protein IPK99_10315 [Flavobacteriales bacterium]|nr:hypothetical protein [Flavobacteriales bacterium]
MGWQDLSAAERIDDYNREVLAIEVDTSLLPCAIRDWRYRPYDPCPGRSVDNGPEFVSHKLDNGQG